MKFLRGIMGKPGGTELGIHILRESSEWRKSRTKLREVDRWFGHVK